MITMLGVFDFGGSSSHRVRERHVISLLVWAFVCIWPSARTAHASISEPSMQVLQVLWNRTASLPSADKKNNVVLTKATRNGQPTLLLVVLDSSNYHLRFVSLLAARYRLENDLAIKPCNARDPSCCMSPGKSITCLTTLAYQKPDPELVKKIFGDSVVSDLEKIQLAGQGLMYVFSSLAALNAEIAEESFLLPIGDLAPGKFPGGIVGIVWPFAIGSGKDQVLVTQLNGRLFERLIVFFDRGLFGIRGWFAEAERLEVKSPPLVDSYACRADEPEPARWSDLPSDQPTAALVLSTGQQSPVRTLPTDTTNYTAAIELVSTSRGSWLRFRGDGPFPRTSSASIQNYLNDLDRITKDGGQPWPCLKFNLPLALTLLSKGDETMQAVHLTVLTVLLRSLWIDRANLLPSAQ